MWGQRQEETGALRKLARVLPVILKAKCPHPAWQRGARGEEAEEVEPGARAGRERRARRSASGWRGSRGLCAGRAAVRARRRPVRVRVRRGGEQGLRASPGAPARSPAGAAWSSRSHTQAHTPRPRGSRPAARSHLHFLNEPLDGWQRRGRAGAVAGSTRRGMLRAPAPEAAAAGVRAREPGREEGKLGGDAGRPGADQADPAAGRPGRDPRAPGQAVRAGRRGSARCGLFPTTKATADLFQVWIPI